MNASSSLPCPKWLHYFAVALAFSTLGLIFAGGLVTSTDSGLAVPDWPLSYGRLMPPMIGGILYEHGHRMVAATVGFLTVVLAFLLTWKEQRLWVKKAAWFAVGLVILQGVLGGLTVLFLLPKPVSIGHACLAQAFFSLVVALAIWTSARWENSMPRVAEDRMIPFDRLSLALFSLLYAQLILGAVLRHTGWGLPFHVMGAILALCLSAWITARAWRTKNFQVLSALLCGATLLQIALGVTTYLVLVHEFDVIPTPFVPVATITAHVALGAFVLGLSAVLALLAYRTRPLKTVPEKAAGREPSAIQDYFALTKPGISFMTGVTALAGFILGSRGSFDWDRLIHTVVGTCLVSAGACALNMLMEIDIDARMRRTEKRPLPSGRLKPGEALLFGSLLTLAGVIYLSWTVNLLTAFLAAVTFSVYLYLYTPLKKITALCTAIGAVAGALPPVMGWAAAAGRLGPEPWVIFAILFFWQYPHFLALAWLYREDYARAGLFMLPVVEPDGESTARKIVMNSFALLTASVFPTLMGLTNIAHFVVALVLGLIFISCGGLFFAERSLKRARLLFFASVIYLPLLVLSLVLNKTA